MRWYKAEVARAHLGRGRHAEVTYYLYRGSVFDVLDACKTLPGTKKGLLPSSVVPLTPDQAGDLERRIRAEDRISLSSAKRYWYIDMPWEPKDRP